MRWPLLFALLPTLAFAQSPAPSPEDLGTVTGHITCSDTQRPARFARVSLAPTKPTGMSSRPETASRTGTYVPVDTDLTGGYTITNVDPGQYYLRVDLAGYVTPFAQFTAAQLGSPTPEIQQRIQHELQLVTVAPNSTVQADATVRRGGSISGTVRFDDGSPAIGIRIEVLRHDFLGTQTFRIGNTNGHGRFNIEALSPGEYVIEATLGLTEHRIVKKWYGDGRIENVVAELATISFPIYSGSVFSYTDAALIKVDPGQEIDDADITIPISRFHEISGTVLAKDGHAVNTGQVALYFADADGKLTDVTVHDDGTFRFAFVPEGNYVLTVAFARDTTPAPLSESNGTFVHTLHTYGDLEQPLTVHTDIRSLNLILPDSPHPAAASSSNGTN